jgi:hypothetical protein
MALSYPMTTYTDVLGVSNMGCLIYDWKEFITRFKGLLWRIIHFHLWSVF